jgi:hypothetical protein
MFELAAKLDLVATSSDDSVLAALEHRPWRVLGLSWLHPVNGPRPPAVLLREIVEAAAAGRGGPSTREGKSHDPPTG